MLDPQLGVDPRRAVHAPAGVVDLLDLLGQPRVRERPIGRRPALPVMKAGPADLEHAAHHGDGIVRLLRGDQRVRLAYRPSSSLAKKTAAFRKISRSIRSFAFSSRSRCKLLALIAREPARALTTRGLLLLEPMAQRDVGDTQLLRQLPLRLIAELG